jgi:hypothetical protein
MVGPEFRDQYARAADIAIGYPAMIRQAPHPMVAKGSRYSAEHCTSPAIS